MADHRIQTSPQQQHVPVLMYHSISTSSAPAFSRFVVRPDALRSHLDLLAEAGYQTITAAALAEARSHRSHLPDRAVVLTFDDAFEDFHSAALPLLTEHGFTATLFVPTAYVGATARWLRGCDEHDRPVLSWSALHEVAAAGIEIGAHSHMHSQLDRVPGSYANADAQCCRGVLEDALGTRIAGFAYPFGYWNRRARDAVRAAGFDYACQVGELTSVRGDDLWAVPRHSIHNEVGPTSLATLLGKQNQPVARTLTAGKRLAWRAARTALGIGGQPIVEPGLPLNDRTSYVAKS